MGQPALHKRVFLCAHTPKDLMLACLIASWLELVLLMRDETKPADKLTGQK